MKHVRRPAGLVAVACFLPGRAKDLSASLYARYEHKNNQRIRVIVI